MTAFRLTVESEEFARIMTNALAFFPARGLIDTAQLRVWPDRIEATGTDTYTLGRVWCSARDFATPEAGRTDLEWASKALPIRVELDHSGWKDVEDMARRAKKSSSVVEYRPGDCLTFIPGLDHDDKIHTVSVRDHTGQGTPFMIEGSEMSRTILWDMCDELLTRLERSEGDIRCFDPALFGRFGKVKVPKSENQKVVDFQWQGDMRPMLAKVGPTFVGAIMPIDRDRREEEELWPT